MSDYQPGIPTGTVNLDVDYENIQKNFTQLQTTFSVDHTQISDNTGQNGYHTAVHLIPVSGIVSNNPQTVANPPNNQPINGYTATLGYGQVFGAQINDGINIDQALFFLSGSNRLTQLTRNFQPVLANNGYTFLPGGLILQWGQITSTSSSFTTLTFSTNNIAFPNSCFAVYTQIYGSGTPAGGEGTIDIRKSTVSATGFQWAMITNSAQYTGFYWMAIGN